MNSSTQSAVIPSISTFPFLALAITFVFFQLISSLADLLSWESSVPSFSISSFRPPLIITTLSANESRFRHYPLMCNPCLPHSNFLNIASEMQSNKFGEREPVTLPRFTFDLEVVPFPIHVYIGFYLLIHPFNYPHIFQICSLIF